MNNKTVLGALTGALIMSVAMTVDTYIVTGYGTSFLWQLGVISSAVYGVVNGAIAGMVIIKYCLNFIRGAVFGLLFNIAIGIAFLIFFGSNVEKDFSSAYYASIIIGAFNGAVVSLFNKRQQQLK